MPHSRQERRKAEHDAAKRAPAQAVPRELRANVNVTPGGDETTHAA
jgi:hypothetical protein